MTEDDAKAWIATRFGTPASERLAGFLDQVAGENERQNLISPATVPTIWARHAVDSAQLIPLAPEGWSHWLDIGTGGGFPGMVIALLSPGRAVTMVEPRRKRAEFLRHCIDSHRLTHARVLAAKVEAVSEPADVISARAVASVENLLLAAHPCAKPHTTWLLPRGRSVGEEFNGLSTLKDTAFHVEHSLTDPQSAILLLKGTGR